MMCCGNLNNKKEILKFLPCHSLTERKGSSTRRNWWNWSIVLNSAEAYDNIFILYFQKCTMASQWTSRKKAEMSLNLCISYSKTVNLYCKHPQTIAWAITWANSWVQRKRMFRQGQTSIKCSWTDNTFTRGTWVSGSQGWWLNCGNGIARLPDLPPHFMFDAESIYFPTEQWRNHKKRGWALKDKVQKCNCLNPLISYLVSTLHSCVFINLPICSFLFSFFLLFFLHIFFSTLLSLFNFVSSWGFLSFCAVLSILFIHLISVIICSIIVTFCRMKLTSI